MLVMTARITKYGGTSFIALSSMTNTRPNHPHTAIITVVLAAVPLFKVTNRMMSRLIYNIIPNQFSEAVFNACVNSIKLFELVKFVVLYIAIFSPVHQNLILNIE